MSSLRWHIGCSGFYYKEWKEVFYPNGLPATKWFEFYCQHFSTLELNNTFYRFPEVKQLEGWYRRAPDDFLFAVKAPRIITHEQVFAGTEALVADFYAVARTGFSNKLGPLLFQLPPHLSYSADKLESILHQLDPAFTNVLEFRHASWWRPDVYRRLQDKGIVFSGISYPDLPNDVISNGPVQYYRFHGLPRLYFSDYSPAFLEQVHKLIAADPQVRTAFLYFNNTAAAAALSNARTMLKLVEDNLTIRK